MSSTKLLRNNLFNYPVAIDSAQYFKKHNKLSCNSSVHTFLVDNENKILAIGNPVINPKIQTLYRNIISENNDIDLHQNYLCRRPIRSLGLVHHKEVKKQSFCLVNRDTTCYTIQKIIPSCSCTTAWSYDSKIHPGKTSNIELTKPMMIMFYNII
ncbi:DUF1573 domain-containing protein [Alistipes sp. Z76]|nr:DUF1573 domain-containing protein [Alistipes sp. Z76]NCE71123.1 DUF1573 domain-containing protein [Muribaculaceae bacterium M3]